MITIREIELAVAVRNGSARAQDLQELAGLVIAKCWHPNERRRMRATGPASSEMCCGLCGKVMRCYTGETWRLVQKTRGLHVEPFQPIRTETTTFIDGSVRVNAGDSITLSNDGNGWSVCVTPAHGYGDVAFSDGRVTSAFAEPLTLRDPRVDWNDVRPAATGGECAGCLHQAPLHEPGCRFLSCRSPESCACRACWDGGHEAAR